MTVGDGTYKRVEEILREYPGLTSRQVALRLQRPLSTVRSSTLYHMEKKGYIRKDTSGKLIRWYLTGTPVTDLDMRTKIDTELRDVLECIGSYPSVGSKQISRDTGIPVVLLRVRLRTLRMGGRIEYNVHRRVWTRTW